ncbi:phosphonate metabolism protein/1,5-bisphosphokinase (PRPP-forming) PhnN [Neorhizobium galegae]|nr:phosphonate metabolism protein/1,5-bisphosphokinase (PRPP-forming) PhnN [Neorhizobium galegae]MCQ1767225.1 phosphonate metabolism protein/1,5-bisphosphokinase (PRPP-forming) PhnN [Neorhizobium galegae]MCQ1846831.1 phosphonate metabolism protein/1,5-bisphosphokinase (PRPP-forming) PhnN [Neorhizobium galegae]CDZ42090.1 Phosphonate metabolism protein/1,5-bisphosphokinase (PRPP-forming) PhnN [Neorhizobium galegae bv. officinalis]
MVAVVGPSGAGKDTLMAYAARFLEGRDDVVFVRRVITRNAAGGEDHDGVSEAEFEALEQAGRFAVSWDAHGLRYGIPVETKEAIAKGQLVVANGSRSALSRFKDTYPSLVVINITASLDVLAARLEARGRETREEILRRLERSSLAVTGDYHVVTIDNSGSLEDAGRALVEALKGCFASHRIG